MKNILLLSILALAFLSFQRPSNHDLNTISGKYGFCGCQKVEGSLSYMELTLNPDQTFHYFDNTLPNKKIDITGNWDLKGEIISLKSTGGKISVCNGFHFTNKFRDKWRVDGNCIKSRSGLAFYRICNGDKCDKVD